MTPRVGCIKSNSSLIHRTQPQHRIMLASFHMEGKVLIWLQDLEEFGSFTSWEAFTQAILVRFDSCSYDDPFESLTKLRQ